MVMGRNHGGHMVEHGRMTEHDSTTKARHTIRDFDFLGTFNELGMGETKTEVVTKMTWHEKE